MDFKSIKIHYHRFFIIKFQIGCKWILMDLIGVLASLASHSQTCPTSPTRQTSQKLVDLLTC